MMRRLKYNLNFVIKNFIPPNLRDGNIQHYLFALLSPIKSLNQAFNVLADSIAQRLEVTSNVIVLESYLNDLFSATPRVIQVTDGNNYSNDLPLFLKSEGQENPIGYLESEIGAENQPLQLYLLSELQSQFDFIIEMNGQPFSEIEVKTIIERYRPASKRYSINP